MPPRRGWEETNVGVPPVPRICFPDCWTEWSSTASWVFSVGTVASLVLYLAIGVMLGRSRRGTADEEKGSMIEWHPQYTTIAEGVGLIRDGLAYVIGCGCGGGTAGQNGRETYDDLPPVPPPKSKRSSKDDERREKKKDKKKDKKKEKKKEKDGKEKRKSKSKPSKGTEAPLDPDGGGGASRRPSFSLVEKRLGDDGNRLHSSQQKIKVAVQTLTL